MQFIPFPFGVPPATPSPNDSETSETAPTGMQVPVTAASVLEASESPSEGSEQTSADMPNSSIPEDAEHPEVSASQSVSQVATVDPLVPHEPESLPKSVLDKVCCNGGYRRGAQANNVV